VFSPECSLNVDFFGKLRIKLWMPIFLTCASGLLKTSASIFKHIRQKTQPAPALHYVLKFVRIFDKIYLLLFTLICSTIMSFFDCIKVAEGLYILRSSPSSRCYDSLWNVRLSEVAFFIVLYLVLSPVRLTVIFLQMMKKPFLRNHPAYQYITRGYKTSYFWWDLVLLVKRLTFVIFSQFLFSNLDSGYRLMCSTFVFMFFLAVDLLLQPYQHNQTPKNNLSIMMILILLCQGTIFEEDESSDIFVIFVFIIFVVCMAHSIIVIGQLLVKKFRFSMIRVEANALNYISDEAKKELLHNYTDVKLQNLGELEIDLEEFAHHKPELKMEDLLSARRSCDSLLEDPPEKSPNLFILRPTYTRTF
jgi:hypothetical protein